MIIKEHTAMYKACHWYLKIYQYFRIWTNKARKNCKH